MRRPRYRRCATLASTLLAVPLLAQPTLAQEGDELRTPSSGGAASTMIQEVKVTARKKGVRESAQSVPVTLTAVTGEQIDAMFAEDLTDVGMTMPNVRLDNAGSFPGGMNFTVRGMGFNSTIASVEPTVGLFVDGMYIGANLGGLGDTFDTQSVEVLRGPQGTLFGRNVTGGAVIMRSRRPTGEYGGVVRAGMGSGGRVLTAAGIEGSLTDTLAGKIYTQYSDRDGDFDNLATGEDYGAEEVSFARPILRWRPSDSVDVQLIGEYGKNQGDGVNGRFVEDPDQLLYQQGARAPDGTENLSLNYRGGSDVEWHQMILDTDWHLDNGTITSITGYRNVSYSGAIDSDATSLDIARALNRMEQDQLSQELRFAGQAFDNRLDYTVGAYYFEQDQEQFYHVYFFGASNQRSRGTLDHKTASIFAQGDYEFLPGAFLTLGGRYTWEEKGAQNARTPDCDIDLNCQLSDSGDETWSNFSPKVGLSWQVNPDILLYSSWTRGFRSGGYNIRTTGENESAGPYDEEEVDALEAGIKSDLWDGKARVNFAVFHNQYKDLQRTVNLGLVNFISNVAEATVDGAELEINLLPVDNLSINASVGYLSAEYDSYPALDVDGDGDGDPEQAKGLQLIRAPEWSYSVSAIYDLSLGRYGMLSNRVAVNYNDKTPANDANSYFTPDWRVWNASMSWSPASGDNLEVSLWGKNLTNETYALLSTYVGSLWTNLYQSLPRRYGVEVSYRF